MVATLWVMNDASASQNLPVRTYQLGPRAWQSLHGTSIHINLLKRDGGSTQQSERIKSLVINAVHIYSSYIPKPTHEVICGRNNNVEM